MKYVSLMVFLGLAMVLAAGAAPELSEPATGRAVAPQAAPAVPATPTTTDVTQDIPTGFLIVCNTDPQKFIVVDGQGNWMPDVKRIQISLSADGAEAECIAFTGWIEPSNPRQTSLHMMEIQALPEVEFQQTIDNLQTDRNFLKNRHK